MFPMSGLPPSNICGQGTERQEGRASGSERAVVSRPGAGDSCHGFASKDPWPKRKFGAVQFFMRNWMDDTNRNGKIQ